MKFNEHSSRKSMLDSEEEIEILHANVRLSARGIWRHILRIVSLFITMRSDYEIGDFSNSYPGKKNLRDSH